MVIVIIMVYSFIPGEQLSYRDSVLQHRQEIHEFMENDPQSPLPDSLKSNFPGLNYFDPDPAYKVSATIETIPGNIRISTPTSDGQIREYIKHSYATFELSGKQHQVTLLQPVEEETGGSLFLPFGDLSNTVNTYGGGRYLDLEITNENSITIDFNLAYNPYCVYSSNYSCPLPPAENQLTVAIKAGEKNFELPQ